jgi:hypothetical protein
MATEALPLNGSPSVGALKPASYVEVKVIGELNPAEGAVLIVYVADRLPHICGVNVVVVGVTERANSPVGARASIKFCPFGLPHPVTRS